MLANESKVQNFSWINDIQDPDFTLSCVKFTRLLVGVMLRVNKPRYCQNQTINVNDRGRFVVLSAAVH